MLVPILGAQGCGKSTLIASLISCSDAFGKVESQAARTTIQKMGYSMQEIYAQPKLIKKFQIETLAQKKTDETKFIESNKIHLIERSYLDLAAYTVANLGRFDSMSSFVTEYVEECIEEHSKAYNTNIKINIGMFDIISDGIRPVNAHYANMIDLYLTDLLTKQHTPTLFVGVSNIDARVKIVCEYFNIEQFKGDIHDVRIF